ncbi:SDR family NAD(P)-dependent oxidoreductase [Okibacterium endophyticum]
MNPTPDPTRIADLAGLRIAVTGGAAGIGRETARRLAELGARVAVLDRDEAGADVVAARVGGIAIGVDIADEDSVATAFDAIRKQFGGLDGLINSAGILGENEVIENTTLAGWNRVIAVNLTGTYLVNRAAASLMTDANGGAIVNLASGVALTPLIPGITAYAASKGGVIALSKTLAKQLGPRRIRVNVLCPGTVDTDMAPLRDGHGELDQGLLDRYALGRGAHPSEIADAAVYLVSPQASFVTGTVLSADGGRSFH